jgi:hypothetical protein
MLSGGMETRLGMLLEECRMYVGCKIEGAVAKDHSWPSQKGFPVGRTALSNNEPDQSTKLPLGRDLTG